MTKTSALILASGSLRRLDLLNQAGLAPDLVAPADVEEIPGKRELPAAMVTRLARAKAKQTARLHPAAYVLAADTVVACGRRILGKAGTEQDARAHLNLLSGRRHRVYTGMALIGPDGALHQRTVVTMVAFKRLDMRETDNYIATGEWRGKAGSYAIQGRAAIMIRAIGGSYSNVVGLPLFETVSLLAGAGYPPALQLR
ncbi:MAG: Maf family protein [Sphingomonadales bacterium]